MRKRPLSRFTGTLLILLSFFLTDAWADTVYLKNGRALSGIIKNDDPESIEIEVCSGGRVTLDKSSVERIEKDTQEEAVILRQKWELQKKEYEEQSRQYKLEQEKKPKEVEFAQAGNNVLVEVTINRKVKATLILDTGASVIMLRRKVAENLGINLSNMEADSKVTLADGRTVEAKHIVLESVQLQGMEAKNIDAVVLMEEDAPGPMRDGLLGMSFLSRFNFKIDTKEKKLVLEKL